ncbi:DUF2306 domain-containing protein [Brevibacillus sp. TJ4]|uniref:DUF2306 domain-containing protein n=1 Tax=Brevibacillus sp. TJ4 TaxID=3234853 RepID=UPI003B9EDCCE
MAKRYSAYGFLAFVSIGFVLYALVFNYIIDPEAEAFLRHKTGLKRELNLSTWLNVMYIHVGFACVALLAGLLNLSGRVLQKSRALHRANGYVYIVSVLVVVLTSGYMAPYATGGKASSMVFNAINMIWPFMTIMAILSIKKGRIVQHQNWMIRSYAFCFTNMVIHLIAALFHQGFGFTYVTSYTIGVYSSLALLLLIPEIIIRVRSRAQAAHH